MNLKISIACLLFIGTLNAQHGANQLYEKSNSNNYQQVVNYKNDNKTNFGPDGANYKINVSNNVKPDCYIITLGLNQESLSVKECNSKINNRLDGFKNALKKLGIKEEEVFVDFISQTKIYDYKSSSTANQVNVNQIDKGFEIKKNIIIKLKNTKLYDKIIEEASDFEIHNIVKVDYIKTNTDKIYEEMFTEANAILESKMKLHQKFSKKEYEETPQVSVNFYSIQPGKQYKNYTAFESSEVQYQNDAYYTKKVLVKQEERKNKTFYYDGIETDYFDKVLNPDSSQVNMQFVMEISVSYKNKIPKESLKETPKKEEPKVYHFITANGDLKVINFKN